ncbi:uncharacterized protein LOC127702834 [Mytilus californianus]|uniref:uncharacterized protein LOC127702834 n=1 Tax=Mytilus californianus TaxID=6549 RepID=UPI00224738E6|nr:uncharacterized protein LOC127702834 [Mytilus californianus]
MTKLRGSQADWTTCLQKPYFISPSWNPITAHDKVSTQQTIEHEIGTFPIKVDVQVRPGINRPERQFYFSGLGSSQRDDDIDSPYGGLVFYYNDEAVVVFAPNKHDGHNVGKVIYTGGSAWSGPVQQSEASAEYRIRAWGKNNFPKPDFESSWIPMDTTTNTYKEVSHGLGAEPDYAIVQVKFQPGLITEAVGSSMQTNPTGTDWGGVIYSYNTTVFRLWAPNGGRGGLFSIADGWGDNKGKLQKSGSVKIYAWKTLTSKSNFKQTVTLPATSFSMNLHQLVDPENNLIDIVIRALDGRSKNFIFHGSGAVQNVNGNDSFGGIVISYSNQTVRFWYPYTSSGALLLVDKWWGQANTQHLSHKVELSIKTWERYTSCPPVPKSTRSVPVVSSVQSKVDGGWSTYGSWSTCSKSCGGGTRFRNRTCSNPFPSNGGINCQGGALETNACGINPCLGSLVHKSPSSTTKTKLLMTNNRTSTSKQPSDSSKKPFSFSFTDVDLPTILVGVGLGVGGSVLLFSVGCIIKHVISKPKATEVVSIK